MYYIPYATVTLGFWSTLGDIVRDSPAGEGVLYAMDLIYSSYKTVDKKLRQLSIRNYDILNAYYAFLYRMKLSRYQFHMTRERLLMI